MKICPKCVITLALAALVVFVLWRFGPGIVAAISAGKDGKE